MAAKKKTTKKRNRTVIKAKRVLVLNGKQTRKAAKRRSNPRYLVTATNAQGGYAELGVLVAPNKMQAVQRAKSLYARAGFTKFKAELSDKADYIGRTGMVKAKRRRATKKRNAGAGGIKRAAKKAVGITKQVVGAAARTTGKAAKSIEKLVRNPRRTKKRNIEQGYYDGKGQFHPVRAATDYDSQRTGRGNQFHGEVFARDRRTKQWHRIPLGKTAWPSKAAAITSANAETTRKGKRKQYAAFRAVPLGQQPNPRAKRIATGDGVDFWRIGDDVYRAPTDAGIDIYGLPMGKRWECSYRHFQQYRDSVFGWAKDVKQNVTHRSSQGPRQSRRRNSTAETNREKFAGSVTGHKDLYFPEGAPKDLSTLGPLVLMETDAGTVKPVKGAAYLCEDARHKLHIGIANPKAVAFDGPAQSLGKIARVEYTCKKPHLGYPETVTWFHDYDSPRPELKSDGRGGLLIAGGGYTVKREGIVG